MMTDKARVKIRVAMMPTLMGALLVAPAAMAQGDAAVRVYWTTERLRNAVPMTRGAAHVGPVGLPAATTEQIKGRALTTGLDRVRAPSLPPVAEGAQPEAGIKPGIAQLYLPKETPGRIVPATVYPGFAGQFTTYRVFPESSAPQTFPYAPVGRLFFTVQKSGGMDPPGDYTCTASVIKPRVIATAGHCVGSPNPTIGGHFFFYTNWLFVPADDGGKEPFGTWTSFSQGVSGPWSNGQGAVPNSEDWGFLDINDHGLQKLSSTTGAFGYSTLSLGGKNLTQLGYPTNLDNGAYMEQNNGTTPVSGSGNAWTMGSAMGKGASGGPWLMNFGKAPSCTGACPTGNNAPGTNYLVAVDSYGPRGQIGYAGASQFNSDWTTLLQTMCGKKAGTC
jgi:V8-like Glu-specific endopeptidase